MNEKEENLMIVAGTCADFFSIDINFLTSKTRKLEACQPRQIAHYIAKEIFPTYPLGLIGNVIGMKSHATILHSCKTIKNLMETDVAVRAYMDNLIPYVRDRLGDRIINKNSWMPCI